MFEHLIKVDKNFILNNQKRERYSVDYWVNFKKEELKKKGSNEKFFLSFFSLYKKGKKG